MKKTPLFFCLLLFTSALLKSQIQPPPKQADSDYKSFIRTYESVFKDEDQTIIQDEVPDGPKGFYPAFRLPEWFFEEWAVHQDKRTAIGISDPGTDSVQGFHQAMMRALALAVLSEKAQIENVLDNYYFDNEGKKTLGMFNSFTVLFASKSFSYKSIVVEKQLMTPFGETILLISFPQAKPAEIQDGEITFRVENFESEQTKNRKPVVLGELMSHISYTDTLGQRHTLQWQRSFLRNGTSIQSGSDTLTPLNFEKFMAYTSPLQPDTTESTDSFPRSFSLKYGLWNSLQYAIVCHLEQMDVFASQVKNLDEQSGKGFQGLTRVIFDGESGFGIRKTEVADNRLWLHFR
ncbi:MAG TPA: hypothetical protein PLI65_11100 [Bacteroidales bacterium]|nr:hypothetical protein [Bacteroidales bacterium]